MRTEPALTRIVSGGQTGVDRAALDIAIEYAIPHGGWCPCGRRAEDGPLPQQYNLKETTGDDYIERTELNVRDSDGTLVLNRGRLEGGTDLTVRLAGKHHKPVLVVQLEYDRDNKAARQWLRENHIRVLNIAGPRESKRPGVYREARRFLEDLLAG